MARNQRAPQKVLAMRPLLQSEPDLLAELLHYLPAACLPKGHVHVVSGPPADERYGLAEPPEARARATDETEPLLSVATPGTYR